MRTADQKRSMLEPEAYELLHEVSVGVPRHAFATCKEECLLGFGQLSKPVVMKIVSPDILHKSDVGGVKLGISTEKECLSAWETLEQVAVRYGASFKGVLLVEQAKPGFEVIVGGMRDEEFGPAVLVAPGGVLVEFLKTPTVFLAPTSKEHVLSVLEGTVLGNLLDGVRGGPPLDKAALAQTVVSVAKLMAEREDISEIDLNPVAVYEDGVKILDARVLLADTN